MHVLRNLVVGLFILWVGVSTSGAQILVRSKTPFDQVMQYEELLVTVKVTNNAGTPLMLGSGGNAKLDFLVERKPGYDVPRLPGQLLDRQILLKDGATDSFEVNVGLAHDIRRTGPITIIPRVRHGGQIFSGTRLLVEIVPGLELAKYRYMVPGSTGSRRICSLRTLSRNRGQRLFLAMENESEGVSLGVFDLGRLVGQAKMFMQSDATGMLHVLHQSGPFRYTHSVFRDDGQEVKKDFLSKGSGAPRLVRDDQGMIDVAGVQAYEGDPYIDRPVIKPFDPSQ